MKSEHWERFYGNNFGQDLPSQFCVLFCNEATKNSKVIEFGCGNGRDSRFLSYFGFKVLGIDASQNAVEYCEKNRPNNSTDTLRYINQNVGDIDVELLSDYASGDEIYVYSRFFQHSIDEDTQEKMIGSVSEISAKKITAFFEFRNDKDSETEKLFGEHYRRYQTTQSFTDMLTKHGFEIQYAQESVGVAKYFQEDPHVTRVIAVRNC